MGIALGPFELSVDVAFDAGPFNASPTWTDVTDDVMASEGVSFSRGARSVGGKPGPGLADLTMRNWAEGSKVAGRWTPGVAASPWHPLKLKRRIRLRARYNGGSWVGLWGGHITDYVPKWVGDAKPVCDLSASDLLTALSLLKAFPNAILAEQLYDDPVLCYPLDDSEGSVTAGDRSASPASSLAVTPSGAGGAVDFGAGSFGPEGATCAAFTPTSPGNYSYLRTTLPGTPLGQASVVGATVVMFLRPAVAAATGAFSLVVDGSRQVAIGTSATGKATANVSDVIAAIAINLTGSTTLSTDTHACVALRQSLSGSTVTVDLLVNGSMEATGTYTSSTIIGAGAATLLSVGAAAFEGQIAHVATYDTALSDARIADHYLAMNGWAGELTGSRFQRLARLAGLPSGLISVSSSAGGSTMGPQPVGGKTLTTALNEVATTDQGSVDIDRTGLLRFAGRDLRRGAASVVTLDARTDILNDFEGLPYNDEGLLNDVTVSRVNGATQRAVNQASSDEYGPITDSIEVWLNDDAEALRLAEWLANKDAQPQLRAPVLKVSMGALAGRSPSKVDAVMALERGQRITVDHLPAGLPATSLDLFVEGISDEWGKNDWVRTITTSSLWRNGAVWILGDSFYGVLGSTTILGY